MEVYSYYLCQDLLPMPMYQLSNEVKQWQIEIETQILEDGDGFIGGSYIFSRKFTI